jgi:hypothetical protein
LELLEKPDILLDEKEYTPHKISDDVIALGGWEFSVSYTIYANATPVIKGWNMFNHDMGRDVINRLFEPFFYRTVKDANSVSLYELRNQEPELIELLRLSCWYYKASMIAKNNTFASKRKEIRGKLTRGLLSDVEQYTTSVATADFIEDMEEFQKKLKDGLINAKKGKPQDEDFKKFMEEVPRVAWAVTSELIFAGMSSDAGYIMYFDVSGQGHDYDFIVNDIPCQVKTILLARNNTDQETKKGEQETMRIRNRIHQLSTGKKIEEDEVKKEILDLLRENSGAIEKAIEQGGRIICVNGTQTYAGFLLNQWASDNNSNLTIHKPLQTSIDLVRKENSISLLKREEKFLPLIFGAAGIDSKYRFSTWSFKVPISYSEFVGKTASVVNRQKKVNMDKRPTPSKISSYLIAFT